jgi:hypothetical protein
VYNKDSRRTKIITFRVSPEEYRTVEAACLTHKLRSVSDLARDAVQQWITVNGPHDDARPTPPHRAIPIEAVLQRVESDIQAFTTELNRLQRLVESRKKEA